MQSIIREATGGILGKVIKGIGSVLKPVAGLAGLAANFVPGGSAVGKILSKVGTVGNIVGGLQQQGQDTNKANGYTGQVGGIGQALAQMGGINPATGQFDPSYNPNAAFANKMFDPSNLIGAVVQNREGIDAQADNAVSANIADSLGRGFLPGAGMNTGADAAQAKIRSDANIANNGFSRELFAQNLQNKNNFLAQGLQTRQNALQGALGTFGGLQGFYADRAAQTGAGIQSAVSGLAKGGFDLTDIGGQVANWFKGRLGKRRQSTSLGTTNAQSSTPGYAYPGG